MASMKTRAIRTALVVGSLLVSQAAFSSAIVAPHGAGRDADLSGNTVADPDDGGSALLINPAGVVGPARDEALVGLLAFNFTASYKNPSNGYDGTGSQTPLGIDMWYGLGEIAGWSLGFGAYGSIGAAFDLPPDPDIGIDSPYVGKLSIINVGFNAGRQLTDRLRVGLQITPRYGRQVVRLPPPWATWISLRTGWAIRPASGWFLNRPRRCRLGFPIARAASWTWTATQTLAIRRKAWTSTS